MGEAQSLQLLEAEKDFLETREGDSLGLEDSNTWEQADMFAAEGTGQGASSNNNEHMPIICNPFYF